VVKLVYSLRERLSNDLKYVAAVQARTLDDRQLPGGLKGIYGLFGSDQWWDSIRDGIAPVTCVRGVITKVYFEGMHNEGRGFEVKMPDGSFYTYSCVSDHKNDLRYYVVGKEVEVRYVTEPLKNPVPLTDGGFQTHTDTVLEISIEG
jgi:hypothetical protein